MDIQAILIEKATVVGHIDLSKYGKPTTFDKPANKGGKDHVSKSDLDSLEHILDRLFAHYKIDITFTKHFRERINDARNKDQITIEELRSLFQKAYAKVGSKLPKMAGIEAVLVDIQSKINVPFAMNVDRNGGLELVSKTIMRKNNFMTTSPKIKVENTMSKTFFDFLAESESLHEMTVDEWQKDADDALIMLNNDLPNMFPGQSVYARMTKNLGPNIVVGVFSIKKGSQELDHMNATGIAKFMMHLTTNFGHVEPMTKFEFESLQVHGKPDPGVPHVGPRTKKVPYRKISGKSPMEASRKMMVWLDKNKENFLMV